MSLLEVSVGAAACAPHRVACCGPLPKCRPVPRADTSGCVGPRGSPNSLWCKRHTAQAWSQRLDEIEHFVRMPRDADLAPLARQPALAVDDERAALDAADLLAIHV